MPEIRADYGMVLWNAVPKLGALHWLEASESLFWAAMEGRSCETPGCEQPAKLQCPTCIKLGIQVLVDPTDFLLFNSSSLFVRPSVTNITIFYLCLCWWRWGNVSIIWGKRSRNTEKNTKHRYTVDGIWCARCNLCNLYNTFTKVLQYFYITFTILL